MPADDPPADFGVVKGIADAVSLQAKAANRMWLATITVTFLVFFPHSAISEDHQSITTLPFGLGDVPTNTFFPIAYFILTTLVIALAAAHAQQLRAHKLARQVIDQLARRHRDPQNGLHPRDLFDILLVPSLTRVAPIAQWIRGKYQYADNAGLAPWPRRLISTIYYLLLKLIVLGVLFVLPGAALFYCYVRTTDSGLAGVSLALVQASGLVAALSLLLVTLADAGYVIKVARILYKKTSPTRAAGKAT